MFLKSLIKGNNDLIGRICIQSVRSIHYKENHKKYPKVNIKDVELDKPRYGFRRDREPLLSQSVNDTIFPSEVIKEKYKEAGKPVPIKYRSNSDRIARRNLELFADQVANGEPHFKVGEKSVYLPTARIRLLRPNAKHTPYQAKFVVPRNFNKFDLRDYLWHVYGLRALNITVQLLHAKFERGINDLSRYRGPQYKKMTIDMEEPFIWPELPVEASKFAKSLEDQREIITNKNSSGSDKNKLDEKAFDGLYKKPTVPEKFISKNYRKIVDSKMESYNSKAALKEEKDLVNKFLNF